MKIKKEIKSEKKKGGGKVKIKKEFKSEKEKGGKRDKVKKEEKREKKKAKRKKKKRGNKSKSKRETVEEKLPDGQGPGRWLGTSPKKLKWIPEKRDVAFKEETTKDKIVFTPDTPADRRLLMDVEGGLEIAKKYCAKAKWNCIHPTGILRKRIGYSCAFCGKWAGGDKRNVIEHEQSCLGGYSKDTVLQLAVKCWGKKKCREVRLACRWALGHQCYLEPDKQRDDDKEERILARLNGDRKGDERILSVNELLYSWKDLVKKKKKKKKKGE